MMTESEKILVDACSEAVRQVAKTNARLVLYGAFVSALLILTPFILIYLESK